MYKRMQRVQQIAAAAQQTSNMRTAHSNLPKSNANQMC